MRLRQRLDCVHTREALKMYDQDEPRRDALFNDIQTHEDVAVWEKAEQDALNSVRRAFHKDTQHINTEKHCMLVGINFLRRCAEVHKG